MAGFWLVVFLFAGAASNAFSASALLPQRVIYVGHRAESFEKLFKQHFTEVKAASREAFKPEQAKDFDVVVLDWPQSGERAGAWLKGVPLGQRKDWNKPTVLLGSAGLNLAVAWKLKGGSGCTCLAPLAYDLRAHPIFEGPIKIDVKGTTNIPTPGSFTWELTTATIPVLPLVNATNGIEKVNRDYEPGWAAHYYEFSDTPEVEFFCSGINDQTPRSSALWRQGDLLHFGFEQSPAEMNQTGRAMLVNAVAYISRFTEDRPIDVTPSIYGGERSALTRRRAANYLTNDSAHVHWATNQFTPATVASFDWHAAKGWWETNRQWVHPNKENYLEVDAEAKALGVPFDAPEFLLKTVAALRQEKTKAQAASLLARYVVEGPGADASADAWEKWSKENSAYLFYSEEGGYRWYIDPLAKKRGVPSKDLRGVARADRKK